MKNNSYDSYMKPTTYHESFSIICGCFVLFIIFMEYKWLQEDKFIKKKKSKIEVLAISEDPLLLL